MSAGAALSSHKYLSPPTFLPSLCVSSVVLIKANQMDSDDKTSWASAQRASLKPRGVTVYA